MAAVDNDGSQYFYHTDQLGGTNLLTDSTGFVRELTEYDPFGQTIVHEKYGSSFATAWYYFTGKPLDDETGLLFLGARYFNPALGRFISPDTIVQAPKNPQTLNRYTYCNNNPVNLTDPDGHSWFSKLFKTIGQFFENLAKHPLQTLLASTEILLAIALPSPGSPFLIASGFMSLINTGTSSWQGGGWTTFHQIMGYGSLALGAVGALQNIAAAFTSATGAAASLGNGAPPLANSVNPSDLMPLKLSDATEETLSFNNVATSVIDKVSLASTIAASVNKAGDTILSGLESWAESVGQRTGSALFGFSSKVFTAIDNFFPAQRSLDILNLYKAGAITWGQYAAGETTLYVGVFYKAVTTGVGAAAGEALGGVGVFGFSAAGAGFGQSTYQPLEDAIDKYLTISK